MHKQLMRQLKRHYGSVESVPVELKALLEAVNSAYQEADADRALLERSMELTSQELIERNHRLRQDITERERAEDQLVKSMSLLNATLESTADGLLVVDENGEVASFNQKFVELWHIPGSLIAARDDAQLLAFVMNQLESPEDFVAKVEELYTDPDATCYDFLHFKDGRTFERYSLPQQIKGKTVGRVWSFHDITERRRAEEALKQANKELELRVAERTLELQKANAQLQLELGERQLAQEALRLSEERHRTLLQSLPQRVFFKDRQSAFVLVNTSFANDLGISPEDLIGKTDYDIHPDELAEKYRADDLRVMDTRRVEILQEVNVARSPDGAEDSERIVEVVKAPVIGNGGEVLGVLGLFTDITERRRAEDRLQRAVAEADNANRAKSEFLSRMSHELRTPLNSILGFGQLLEMSNLSLEDQPHVTYILQSGRHLLDLINEVLDIAQIESGKMSLALEPVSISEVAMQCVDVVRPLAAKRNIQLQTGVSVLSGFLDCHVLADHLRLKQVLLNVLANAVKYNREGGSVSLECEEIEGEGEGAGRRVLIKVVDTGPGIEADKLERLFIPFDRLDAEKSDVEGTGLGLTLSQRLMEAMGGTIGAESKPGEGSTLSLTLPAAERPVERLKRADSGSLSSADLPDLTRTVLYIEDNYSNLRLVEGIFKHDPSIKILAAMRGLLGLDLARKHRPDVILLDLHLPDIGGEDVLRMLREDQFTRSIPVLILSADAIPGQRERLLAAGAQAYITKPLAIKEFVKAVNEELNVAPGMR